MAGLVGFAVWVGSKVKAGEGGEIRVGTSSVVCGAALVGRRVGVKGSNVVESCVGGDKVAVVAAKGESHPDNPSRKSKTNK